MKRSIKSLILLVVLVALLGSYALVNRMNRQAEVAEEAGTFAMSSRGVDELTGLVWTNDQQYHFTKDEDGWVNADNAAFPVNQDVVSELAKKLSGMEATRKLTDVKKLEDYGFGDDSFTVTAEWSDGEKTVYILGDETPFADGYYARIDGEEGVVYTMTASLSAMFAETAIDLAQPEEIGKVETPLALDVGNELKLAYQEESVSINPDQHWYSAEGEAMDDEAVESLIADIEALEWQELVDVSADEETLGGYGLDVANAMVISVIGDDGDSVDLLIGGVNEDGAYYARLPGSDMVYTMEAEGVEAVIGSIEEDFRISEIFPLEFEQVQQFSCMLDGKEMTFDPAGDCEGAEDEEAETEDASASEESDPAEDMWSRISGLHASERSEAEPSGEDMLKISVTNTEDISLDCSFYSYNVDSYLAVIGDDRTVLVSADDVDKLIRALKQ